MTNNSGSSFVMFAVGIAVGAAVAALYAPVSGTKLRKRIGEVAGDGADMAQDALNQADDFVRGSSEVAKKVVNRSGNAVRTMRDQLASAGE
jgi:gas vesicle protein